MHHPIPDQSNSYWLDSVEMEKYSPLLEDKKTETIVVGGGIAGITTAYLLSRRGMKVTLLESERILHGTTGFTTAKLTAQHDVIYSYLLKKFGQEPAKMYYASNIAAKRFVEKLIIEENIPSQLTEERAYIYASDDKGLKNIEKEYEAYQKLGIEKSRFVENVPLQLDMKGALAMEEQAQFHPLPYLTHLAEKIIENGGEIYENTRAVDLEKGKEVKITTDKGHKVSADNAVLCTHYPFYDKDGSYYTRLQLSRSYTLAIKPNSSFPGGMYLNAGHPKRSLRSAGDNLILVGGAEHPTGKVSNTEKHYEALRDFSEDVFGIQAIPYRWSAQDPSTLDKIPYIGRLTRKDDNVFVATGFRKWGMTNGTVAGLLLSDIITGLDNPFKDLYDPARVKWNPGLKKFISANSGVAVSMAKGKVNGTKHSFDDISVDEAAVINTDNGREGVYKDMKGEMYRVDTTCTHKGCEVEWNNSERTWDCPCHGSRFSYDGSVMEGPAVKPLHRYSTEK